MRACRSSLLAKGSSASSSCGTACHPGSQVAQKRKLLLYPKAQGETLKAYLRRPKQPEA